MAGEGQGEGLLFFSPSPLSSPIKGEEIIKKNFST
jgi:hypothetical protein